MDSNVIKVTGAGAFLLTLGMLAGFFGLWALLALALAWIVGIGFWKAVLLSLVVTIIAKLL